jgi:hypothetical protein
MSLETTLSLIAAGISIVVAVSSVWATYRAPVHALRIQRMLDEAKERSGRKLWIYKTLMSNRATRLKLEFVQALNLIDIEFLEPGEKGVRDAWKELNDHYTDWGAKTEERKKADEFAIPAWPTLII